MYIMGETYRRPKQKDALGRSANSCKKIRPKHGQYHCLFNTLFGKSKTSFTPNKQTKRISAVQTFHFLLHPLLSNFPATLKVFETYLCHPKAQEQKHPRSRCISVL